MNFIFKRASGNIICRTSMGFPFLFFLILDRYTLKKEKDSPLFNEIIYKLRADLIQKVDNKRNRLN